MAPAIGRRAGAALLFAAALAGAGASLAAPAGAALVPEEAQLEALAAVPVQFDGRTMPFETQARNAVWTVTRKRCWPGGPPVSMVAGWVIDPQGWQNEPIVRVRADVAALAGLPSGTRYASFRDLVSRPALIEALKSRP